jgi:hypothetical protein
MNPYLNLHKNSFWSNAVAKSDFSQVQEGLYTKKYEITKDDIIASAGSCFAQHIAKHLSNNNYKFKDFELPPQGLWDRINDYGYGLYSARYGNIYTTKQLLQLAKEVVGEFAPTDYVWKKGDNSYIDAFRPTIEPVGFDSIEEVYFSRKFHLSCVSEMMRTVDVFIFTLGLTECWYDDYSKFYLPMAPGVVGGIYDSNRFKFKNLTYNEIRSDLLDFMSILNAYSGKTIRYMFTVSPVPLTATASGHHILPATVYSKSTLRAVVGDLFAEYENVDYFPSFELITNCWDSTQHFLPNMRSVKPQSVDLAMSTFMHEHKPFYVPSVPDLKMASGDASSVICDDYLLDTFK